MTIERTNVFSGPLIGNGVTVTFPFTFQAASVQEVSAQLNLFDVDPAQYTVALNPDGTGSITFFVAPVGQLYIFSNPLFTQEVDFEDQGPFYQSSVNEPIDRSALRDLWLRDRVSRSFQVPITGGVDGLFPVVLPGGIPGFASGTGADSGLRTDLASGLWGTALVAWRNGGVGAVVRSLFARLTDLPVSVKDFGALGDGVTDDTVAIHKARDSGARKLYFPVGVYRTTGISFSGVGGVVELEFAPGAALSLISAPGRIALDIQKQVFTIRGRCEITGDGTYTDLNATVGLRHGTKVQGQAYLTIEHLIVRDKFSSRCFVSYACVNVCIRRADIYAGNVDAGSTCYGICFEPKIDPSPGASNGSTMVIIEQAYINGGLRGFFADSLSWADLGTLTLEYGGSTSVLSYNGALHLERCQTVLIRNIYTEQNNRNRYIYDTGALFVAGAMLAALASDIIQYSAAAFDVRGVGELTNRSLKIGELLPDNEVNYAVTTGLHIEGTGAGQVIYLNGTRLLTTRQAAVADAAAATYAAPSGGATVDTQARASLAQLATDVASVRTQLNVALARLRAHGLIAP